jgi:hypothetical protein
LSKKSFCPSSRKLGGFFLEIFTMLNRPRFIPSSTQYSSNKDTPKETHNKAIYGTTLAFLHGDNKLNIHSFIIHPKHFCNIPDFTVYTNNGKQLKVSAIGDTHTTGNIYCDCKKFEARPDFFSFYFTNEFKLYLIPARELSNWLQKNKGQKEKVRHYKKKDENKKNDYDHYIVKISLLMKEIPEIIEYCLN